MNVAVASLGSLITGATLLAADSAPPLWSGGTFPKAAEAPVLSNVTFHVIKPYAFQSDGYRKLYSFNFATLVHLGTISFVRRFVDWKDDYWTYLHREKKKFDPWLEHADATVVANALIVLVQRTLSLLGKQLQSQESAFVESGGIRERMSQVRVAARDTETPACPECGKPMRRRHSKKRDFWGCSGYPDCRGLLDIPQPS